LRPPIGATIAIASQVAVGDKRRGGRTGNGAAKTRNLRLRGSDQLQRRIAATSARRRKQGD